MLKNEKQSDLFKLKPDLIPNRTKPHCSFWYRWTKPRATHHFLQGRLCFALHSF